MRICEYLLVTMMNTDVLALQRAEALLKSVAHVVRIQIVRQIQEHGSRCVHELVDDLGLRQPLVSQHLRVLRSAGVVDGEREGQEVRYRLRDAHVWHIVNDAIEHSGEVRREEGSGLS
jgi:ArsR family transcriptional regulator, zinc-responsive transcriptional repressor